VELYTDLSYLNGERFENTSLSVRPFEVFLLLHRCFIVTKLFTEVIASGFSDR